MQFYLWEYVTCYVLFALSSTHAQVQRGWGTKGPDQPPLEVHKAIGFLSNTGPEIIKLFSCSTQLSTEFQLLIKTKIPTNKEVVCFKSLKCCIYLADKCLNANNCWHFNIYEQDKFGA